MNDSVKQNFSPEIFLLRHTDFFWQFQNQYYFCIDFK